jgi:extracellular elastinolytic metalloproteinase
MNKRRPKIRIGRRIPLVAAVCLAIAAGTLPAFSSTAQVATPQTQFQGDSAPHGDFDARAGVVRPTADQLAAVRRLGANARWNSLGTPQSLIKSKGFLAAGLSSNAVAAARQWIMRERSLFRLSRADVEALQLASQHPIGSGRVVVFKQKFGDLSAALDGSINVAVSKGRIAYAASSLTGDTRVTNRVAIGAERALTLAAADVGRQIDASDITRQRRSGGWTRYKIKGFTGSQSARLVAVPTATQGVRQAFQTSILDIEARPLAMTHYIDAETGDVLVAQSAVDHLDEDSPEWSVFPAYPPLDYSSNDTRQVWCWEQTEGCVRVLNSAAMAVASPNPWDVLPPATASTFTSLGNAAKTVENWNSANPFTVGVRMATPSPTREYIYPWTNQWFEERCNPAVFTSPEQNDIDAAIANLNAMHNRMHDWSYFLGFTEQTWNLQWHNYGRGEDELDYEQGNAQAGGIVGGPPQFLARDNANQITPDDGQAPITNMYLWQPIAGGFYAPCVDGDYDMSVIGHEYAHAITNRMIGGPDEGIGGFQGGAMGESWSDLNAMEYLNEYSFVPIADENPYAVGPYATGNKQTAIRNYGMNNSPLNYSDIGYDMVCNLLQTGACAGITQVHADGEIWSATNFDIRAALNGRYGAGDAALQASCADGLTPVTQCPGNRRWVQLMYDSYLLMPTPPTMLDARDAMLAADVLRFNSANQDLIWNAFARRGFGQFASTVNSNDFDPIPSFASPHSGEANVRFTPTATGETPVAEVFIGKYEARVTPVADTDPATPLGDSTPMVPGTYEAIIRANGYGAVRVPFTVTRTGRDLRINVRLEPNLASASRGATATGDGINIDKLIDDTEETNWAYLGPADSTVKDAGIQVTVRLDPSRAAHDIRRAQVSALLRPPNPNDPGGDTGGQNRFTALRQFELWTCRAQGPVDCSQDDQFVRVFVSAEDAFDAGVPRPLAPNLIMKSFTFPQIRASHVRLVVLDNQCTGAPEYAGDQDDDPLNVTDCQAGSPSDQTVRAAELQVFRR